MVEERVIDKTCVYYTKKEMGRGAFGTKVYQGRFNDKLVAVKKIPPQFKTHYEQELQLFKDNLLGCVNLMVYYHSCQTNDASFIIMELCFSNLTNYVENKKEVEWSTKKKILLQTTKGLDYLHSKGYIHRDMKPDNILITYPDVKTNIWIKVSDYGICRQLGTNTHFTNTGIGTLLWGAPEVFKIGNYVSKAADVFSLGNIFYYVLSWGGFMFPELKKWFDFTPVMEDNILSPDCVERRLIDSLISREPEDRPKTNFILTHPFFWNNMKNLEFISEVGNILENKQSQVAQDIEKQISMDSADVLGQDWIMKVDQIVKDELNKNRGKRNQMKGTSMTDLVRAIRNKATHYETLTLGEKTCFGTFPEDFFYYWEKKFPKLLLHLWENVHSIVEKDNSDPVLIRVNNFYQTAITEEIKSQELNLDISEPTTFRTNRDTKDFYNAAMTGAIYDWVPEAGWKGALEWLRKGMDKNIKTSKEQGLLHLAARWNSPILFAEILKRHKEIDFNVCDRDGNTPLHIAAECNSQLIAEKLLENGALVTAENLEGLTPLHFCSLKNSVNIATPLIDRGADVNAKTVLGRTALHLCAEWNHSQVAEVLLQLGAKIDSVDYHHRTALHVSAEKNSLNVAKLLIEKGANVNAKDKNDETPLHYCSMKNSSEIATCLLEHEIDINWKNKWGKTALHISCIYNSKETASVLSSEKSTLAIQDDQGRLPIHYCAMNGCREMAEELVQKESEFQSQDANGWTPMHYCAMNDSDQMAKLLFQKEIDSSKCDKSGENWFHISSWFNAIKVLQLYHDTRNSVTNWEKDKLSAINELNRENLTPLHLSAIKNSKEVAELLILIGANVNASDHFNQTSLHICASNNSKDVANILIANKANVSAVDNVGQTPLHDCATKNSKDVAVILLANGAEVNVKNNFDQTPLHFCAWNNSNEVAQVLIQKGANVNAVDKNLVTAIHVSAMKKFKEITETLIANNAIVDVQNEIGETPLHFCAHFNSIKVAKCLIDNKANVNKTNQTKQTPLHICAENNFMEIASILIEEGVNVNATNNLQQTALHVCAEKNSTKVAQVLLENGADVNAKDGKNRTARSCCNYYKTKDVAEILDNHLSRQVS